MKKLKLNLEALKVESFITMAASGKQGTVLGQTFVACPNTEFASCGGTCREPSCDDNCATDINCGTDVVCPNTEFASCGGTCDQACG